MSGDNPSRSTDGHIEASERAGGMPMQERRRWPREEQAAGESKPGRAPALKPLEFSTRGLPRKEQFGAWQAYMEPLLDLRLPEDKSPASGFPADHTAWNLGSVLIVQQRVSAHSYERSAAKLRASSIDHWCVGILRSGRSWTEVDGQVAQNAPGKAEFRTLGHPFCGRTVDAESVILYMPRDMFPEASRLLDARNNCVLSGNLATLLINYVSSVEASLPSLVAEDLSGIVQTLRDIVTVCLSSSAEQGTANAQQAIGTMERARRYIHQNLASPDLTPDNLCHELGISRTRLYQLFEPSGGVQHYIRRRRLLAAHAALSDTANTQRILDIAEAAGFDSAANFSRAFKLEFGYSPREARNLATASRATYGTSAVSENAESFRAWLAALGH
jgi:AraC-like DNA-binding protein